jgi:hypothetical protein
LFGGRRARRSLPAVDRFDGGMRRWEGRNGDDTRVYPGSGHPEMNPTSCMSDLG